MLEFYRTSLLRRRSLFDKDDIGLPTPVIPICSEIAACFESLIYISGQLRHSQSLHLRPWYHSTLSFPCKKSPLMHNYSYFPRTCQLKQSFIVFPYSASPLQPLLATSTSTQRLINFLVLRRRSGDRLAISLLIDSIQEKTPNNCSNNHDVACSGN